MKIMTVVGTRPELIRLSVTIKLLDKACDHVLVHTTQNWDPTLNRNLVEELGIRTPDLDLRGGGESKLHFMGDAMIALAAFVRTQKPDAILILGDTNSCLSAGLVANHLRIPLFHCEAGNRCWDKRVPEESNRRMIDSMADFNLVYGEQQRLNLIREGHHPSTIVKTGSPMKQVISEYHRAVAVTSAEPYFALSVHRAENLRDGAEWLEELIRQLPHRCVVSTHPRLEQIVGLGATFQRPKGLNEWWNTQRNAAAVLSDSGTLPEEAYLLDFPAVNLRKSNERPEATEAGIVSVAGTDPDRILAALGTVGTTEEVIDDYEITNFAERVWSCLTSHI